MTWSTNDLRPFQVQFGTLSMEEAPRRVIGREELVEKLWRDLEGKSIRLMSERRMGKTWILLLARALQPEGAVCLHINAEDKSGAPDFVFHLNEELHQAGLVSDNWRKKIKDWFRRIEQKVQGQDLGKITLPTLDSWGNLLENTCQQFIESCDGKMAVLMIDELPYLLDKIIGKKRFDEAIELLDKLRALRQKYPTLRMIYCGSLSLHLVLKKLNDEGYTGQPINDLSPFEVPPLSPDDASYLAGCLLLGGNVQCSDINQVAKVVAEQSNGVPFYIQHAVKLMIEQRIIWMPQECEKLSNQLYTAEGDPAQFAYYENRLDQHYPEDIALQAREILDVLSESPEGRPFTQLENLVRHRPKMLTLDPERILHVLRDLQQDHYIVLEKDHWRFKLEIVRRWWYEARGRYGL